MLKADLVVGSGHLHQGNGPGMAVRHARAKGGAHPILHRLVRRLRHAPGEGGEVVCEPHGQERPRAAEAATAIQNARFRFMLPLAGPGTPDRVRAQCCPDPRPPSAIHRRTRAPQGSNSTTSARIHTVGRVYTKRFSASVSCRTFTSARRRPVTGPSTSSKVRHRSRSAAA